MIAGPAAGTPACPAAGLSVVSARNGAGRRGELGCVVLLGEVIVAFVRRPGVGVLPEEVADDDEERQADRDGRCLHPVSMSRCTGGGTANQQI